MKALLIGINAKYIHPAVSLYQLKANTSYECNLLEYTIKHDSKIILQEILSILEDNDYKLIGCSVYLWNIQIFEEILKEIKLLHPEVYISLGGPEVAYDAKYYLNRCSYVDFITTGEGEDSFNELCKYVDGLIDLKDVSNLYYRNKLDVSFTYMKYPDLNKIKLATLDILDIEHRIVYLESSRGCPYNCAYCTASLEKRVRYFPKEQVFHILKVLMEKKVPCVKFLDRTFNANYQYMMDILDFINLHNICTIFQFEVVGETLRKETIEKINSLKRKWLRFEIGIQSTNEYVNKAVNRHQDMDKLAYNINLLNQTNKVDLHVDLIAGLPYETKESFISSFNQAFMLRGKELQLGFLKFLRGTKMMEMIDEHEYIYDENPPYEIIQNKYMSKDDFKEISTVEVSLNRYYNSGWFKIFDYLLNNSMIENPYLFFKELYTELHHYQKHDLFIHFDLYLKKLYPLDYPYLSYLLKIDYLNNFKVRPKIWWDKVNIDNRNELFDEVIKTYPHITKEDLYRYSVIIKYDDPSEVDYFIVIYKNYINEGLRMKLKRVA